MRSSQTRSSHTEQMLMYLRVLSPLRPLQVAGIPSSGHQGLERRRESSQGKEVVPLGLKLPQEGGVCAVVLLLPWDAGWEEFVWNAVNCIFSWGTRALPSSERAIMYLNGSLLCHSGIPKTQIGNRILASNNHVTWC